MLVFCLWKILVVENPFMVTLVCVCVCVCLCVRGGPHMADVKVKPLSVIPFKKDEVGRHHAK
jgi:hypothetical protein